MGNPFACRAGCGGCCVAISISSPIIGQPLGKPAGVRCVHLSTENWCGLWGTRDYPDVCQKFTPDRRYCGDTRDEAMSRLAMLERDTTPAQL